MFECFGMRLILSDNPLSFITCLAQLAIGVKAWQKKCQIRQNKQKPEGIVH